MHKQRARNDADKQQRRDSILATAATLFADLPYEAVTMAEVAKQLGVVKGTVYLYFATKEELFLALLTEQLLTWFNEVNSALNALPKPASATSVAAVLSHSLNERLLLTRLLAILATVLEKNVPVAAARQFKTTLRDQLLTTGPLLEQCLPFLPPGGGAQLLLYLHALVVGLRHLADPAPAVQAVLQAPEMQVFQVDFAVSLNTLLQAVLAGLASQPRPAVSTLRYALPSRKARTPHR